MNPFMLIGFFVALFCGIKYANAMPMSQNVAHSVGVTDSTTTSLNNEDKMNTLLYKISDTNVSSDTVNLNQTLVETTTHKSQNDESKLRRRRRLRHRKYSHSDCRTTTTTTPKPTTTKPTKLIVQLPGLFTSHSWGPGR